MRGTMAGKAGGSMEPSWKALGELVRRRREARGLSLRELAKETHWSFSLLSKWERGERRPSAEAISRLDAFLVAEGQLVAAGLRAAMAELAGVRGGTLDAKASAVNEDDVERRAAMRLLAGIGSGATVPLPALESVFSQIERVLDERVDLDDWERTVAEYAYLNVRQPVGTLIQDLTADVAAVARLLGRGNSPRTQAGLLRVSAGLSGLLATEFADLGDRRATRLSWRAARRAADASGDRNLSVWVRAKEADDARWMGAPASAIAAQVDEAVRIANGAPSYGLFRAHTVRAELAAGRGDHLGARAAMHDFISTMEHLPAGATAPDAAVSLFESGLGETFLGWHEAYVRTLIRDGQADPVAERALAGYPAETPGPVALLQLMRAVNLVRSRDIGEGLAHAVASVETGVMTTARRHIIGQILEALPEQERGQDAARHLRALASVSSAA